MWPHGSERQGEAPGGLKSQIHDVNQQDASSLQSGETGQGGLNGQMPEYNTVTGMVEPDGIEPTT